MEVLAKIAFGMYALIILCGGAVTVTAQSLVRALIGLIATLFAVAGMYLLLAAPLIAFMQILIYVGAVCVLIFFAIMLTRAAGEGKEAATPTARPVHQYANAVLVLLAPAVFLSWVIIRHPAESVPVPAKVTVAELGKGLLEPYTLSFELISVVLLAAMAGAVLLIWEKRRKE